ncbi:MAG: undecaprenyl-diphosphate phosphatase [Candidatus Dojkabacteria bacterium]
MEMFNIVLLAIEQGITELLPISSSAHLILTGQLLDIKVDTYLLSVFHLGTTIATVIYFLPLFLKNISKKSSLLFYTKVIVATIPVALIGLLFKDIVEQVLRGNIIIVISLILWGIVMIFIESRYTERKEIDPYKISWKQSLTMGFAQILALIPGTSRSAITTIAGIFSGVNKYSAIQFSFILSIPILLGASIYGIYEGLPTEGFTTQHLVGITLSAIVGYISLQFLKRIKKGKWLSVFGYYRIVLGITILLLTLL